MYVSEGKQSLIISSTLRMRGATQGIGLAPGVPHSSTRAGPACVSATVNPGLGAKGQLGSGWRAL